MINQRKDQNLSNLETGDFIKKNAPFYTYGLIMRISCLNKMKTEFHIPHSPGVSLCDFWIFPKQKIPLKRSNFDDV